MGSVAPRKAIKSPSLVPRGEAGGTHWLQDLGGTHKQHFHGNTAKKQPGGSPEGYTIQENFAAGKGTEIQVLQHQGGVRAPTPTSSTHKTTQPQQLGVQWGPCARILVIGSLVLPACWGAVCNCNADCRGCAMPLIYSLKPPAF